MKKEEFLKVLNNIPEDVEVKIAIGNVLFPIEEIMLKNKGIVLYPV